jgi:peptidoglycan hydrolase-like protein with peptidoglycan-binding domain
MTSLTATDRNRIAAMKARLERTPTLGAGEQGGAVKALENVLTSLGFKPGAVDVDFTTRTAGELKQFQSAVGLAPTGTLDSKTVAQLEKALARMRSNADAVTLGEKSQQVALTEKQLARLGYRVGTSDGVADRALGKAIQAFKKDQANLKDSSATLGARGQEILAKEAAALRHAPLRDRFTLTNEMKRADGVLAELSQRVSADGTQGLGEGASRPAIVQLQRRLKAAGFDPKNSNGVFDERTRGALEAFQRSSGVPVTGRLDKATWGQLKKTIINTDSATAPAQTLNERSGEVLATEKLLKKAGFATGKVDGHFTAQTAKAVRALERKAKRAVDGKMSTGDLAALKKLLKPAFPEPKPDWRRLGFRGVTLNGRTIEMLKQAEAWAKRHGVPTGWAMYQGSFHSGTAASAGTHDGGGAIDFKTTAQGKSAKQIRTMVEALRRAGFAAWHRAAPAWSPDHIHAIAIGDRDLSSGARAQVREYFAGGDGLSGSARDPHSAIGRPIPAWAKRFR